MAKNKSLESELKGSGPKRKKSSSNEVEVCVNKSMENKVKKKKRKTEVEEAPLHIPEISIKTEKEKQEKDNKHKKKQATEETKKKKKKKKQTEIAESPTHPEVTCDQEDKEEMEGEEDLSPEEQRAMERKMKKILKKEEKKIIKAEGKTLEKPEVSMPIAPKQALVYLTCWAENRKEWRFQKTRQTWLLQHMFHSEKVPDENFSVLLLYMEGLRGAARDTTVQKALALVKELGEGPGDTDAQQRAHRAREVIQLLT